MKKSIQSRILIIVLIVVIVVVAWQICDKTKRGTLIVRNVAKDTTFHVSTLNFTFPAVLKLAVHANLNDSFELGVFGKFRGGELDTTVEIDHYTRKFDVKYLHYKATTGNILIKYDLP